MTHSPSTPTNPAQGVSEARFDTVALEAARDIMKLARAGEHDDHLKAKIQVRIIEALTAAIGAGGQAVNLSTSPAPVQEAVAGDYELAETVHGEIVRIARRHNPLKEPIAPAPQAPGVSEAMVEAARKVIWGRDLNHLHGDDLIRAALEAAIAVAPAGGEWRLVPVEPTKAMIEAGFPCFVAPTDYSARKAWSAMLAASPAKEERS